MDPIFEAAKLKLQNMLECFPGAPRNDYDDFPVFGPGTTPIIPIGVEVLVITLDNKFLLRHRGPLHDTGVDRWGISFAGYILAEHDEKYGSVNPLWTIARKAVYEINTTIEVRICKCLGRHYNRLGKTMDLLGVYLSPREHSSKIFEGLATGSPPPDGVPFLTTKALEKVQLEHSLNVFLPFRLAQEQRASIRGHGARRKRSPLRDAPQVQFEPIWGTLCLHGGLLESPEKSLSYSNFR
jgi:hypothetical protein